MTTLTANIGKGSDLTAGLGKGSALAANLGEGAVSTGYGTEYQAIYDAYTTKPSDATAAIWNTCVETWVANGEWATKDVIWVYAAHTNGAGESLINWKNPGTYDATAFNAPAHVANQGFTGAATKHIDCNWNPSTNGVNYLQNSASMGLYCRTNVQEAGRDMGVFDFTHNSQLITRFSDDKSYIWFNNNSALSVTNTDSRGMYIVSRLDATDQDLYRNKIKIIDGSAASTGVPNRKLYVLAQNNNGVIQNPTTRQISMAFAGAGMTQTQVNNFTDPFEVAMDALGTGVIP